MTVTTERAAELDGIGRCQYCWEIATQLGHGHAALAEYRQIHHHAHERLVERCHATSAGVRCCRPAGHVDDCRFPKSAGGVVEQGIELIGEARRWQIIGIDDLLDTLQIALQGALDELDGCIEERDQAIRDVGAAGGGEL